MWPFNKEQFTPAVAEVTERGIDYKILPGQQAKIAYPNKPIYLVLASDKGFQAYFLEVGKVTDLKDLPTGIYNAPFLIIKRPSKYLKENDTLFAFKGLRPGDKIEIGSDPKFKGRFVDIRSHIVAPRAAVIGLDIQEQVLSFTNVARIHQGIMVGVRF